MTYENDKIKSLRKKIVKVSQGSKILKNIIALIEIRFAYLETKQCIVILTNN